MTRSIALIYALLEWLGLGGLVAIMAYIPWEKMALGAILTLLGAFYPHSSADRTTGQGSFKGVNYTAFFKGSLRAGVIIAGILLIIGAVIDGYSEKSEAHQVGQRTTQERAAKP